MNQYKNANPNNFLSIVFENKYKIAIFTFFVTLITAVILFYIPNTYKSSAVLSGADISGNNSPNILSNYSNLASVAGISISSQEKEERVAMGIEIIKSLEFFENISKKNNIFFKIMAISDWNKETRKLVINEKIYSEKEKKWVYEKEFSVNGKPSMQTAHREFLDNLSISTDRKTGFIKISYVHFSPDVAKEIVSTIVEEVNEDLRLEDIYQAEESIKILTNEYENTQLNQIRSGLSYLIQQNIEKKTTAVTTPEYLFKILSDPISSERKNGPQKLIILIISFISSLILFKSIFLFRKIFKVQR